MEWWRPKNKKQRPVEAERYSNCFDCKQVWEVDPGYAEDPHHWMIASSTIILFLSRTKKPELKIPKKTLDSIRSYFSNVMKES
ncbi:unnamed protein product [Calypogeia fissa]